MCWDAGGGDGAASAPAEGITELVAELLQRVPPRLRRPAGPLLFAIDHCFGIRGQGTVLTGTVLRVRSLCAAAARRLLMSNRICGLECVRDTLVIHVSLYQQSSIRWTGRCEG